MSRVVFDIALASAIFFGLALLLDVLFFDGDFGGGTIMTTAFRTIMFAMVYAAIRVGMIIFKDTKNETGPKD